MFPLRDDQPVFSTPFVTYFLIAINLLIYFFEWQSELAEPRNSWLAHAIWRGTSRRNRTAHRHAGLQSRHRAAARSLPPCSLHGSLLHVHRQHVDALDCSGTTSKTTSGTSLPRFLSALRRGRESYAHHVQRQLAHAEHRRERSDRGRDGRVPHSLSQARAC